MLKQCSNKLAFSKSKWYMTTLYTMVPTASKPCTFRQVRCSATLLEINPFKTTAHEVIIPRLEPLKKTTLVKRAQSALKVQLPQANSISPTDLTHRCSAFKKTNGKQCQRRVIVKSKNGDEPVFCFQHGSDRKRASAVTAVNSSNMLETSLLANNEKLVDCWDLWLNSRVKKQNQKLIKQEMIKPVSESDRAGYIYVYCLDEGPRVSHEKYAFFKIGRTNDPHRRMYQLSYACKYVPKIIELFPSFPTNVNKMLTNLETLDEREIDDLPKCPLSHRVERLILLELDGLYKKGGFKCPKCGTTHREWFKIKRIKNKDDRLMTDKELFEVFIRPTILRWIQYGVIASALVK